MQDNLSMDYSLLVKHSIPKMFIPFQENKLPLHQSILPIKGMFYTDKNFRLYQLQSKTKETITKE